MHDLVAGWLAGAEEQTAETAVTAVDMYKIEDTMIIPIILREKVTLPLHKTPVDSRSSLVEETGHTNEARVSDELEESGLQR